MFTSLIRGRVFNEITIEHIDTINNLKNKSIRFPGNFVPILSAVLKPEIPDPLHLDVFVRLLSLIYLIGRIIFLKLCVSRSIVVECLPRCFCFSKRNSSPLSLANNFCAQLSSTTPSPEATHTLLASCVVLLVILVK